MHIDGPSLIPEHRLGGWPNDEVCPAGGQQRSRVRTPRSASDFGPIGRLPTRAQRDDQSLARHSARTNPTRFSRSKQGASRAKADVVGCDLDVELDAEPMRQPGQSRNDGAWSLPYQNADGPPRPLARSPRERTRLPRPAGTARQGLRPPRGRNSRNPAAPRTSLECGCPNEAPNASSFNTAFSKPPVPALAAGQAPPVPPAATAVARHPPACYSRTAIQRLVAARSTASLLLLRPGNVPPRFGQLLRRARTP